MSEKAAWNARESENVSIVTHALNTSWFKYIISLLSVDVILLRLRYEEAC